MPDAHSQAVMEGDADSAVEYAAAHQDQVPAGTPALGAAVGRGVAWSVLGAALGKGLSFASQIVLGWLLSKDDFGLYAIAISASAFALAVRDGGLWNVLLARGAREYDRIAGPTFWISILTASVVAAVMCAAAPMVAQFYGNPSLAWMVVIIAVSWPLSAPGWVLRGKMIVDMRFREWTVVCTVSNVVRFGSMIAFAAAGMGPLSFVLPLLPSAVVDVVLPYFYTRDRPWRRSPDLAQWKGLFSEGGWSLLGTVANTILEQGNYLVIGALLAKSEVGTYFFASQLVFQLGALLTFNVQGALIPAFSRLHDDPVRLREAALRSLRAVTLINATAAIGLCVVFGPAEQLIWRGRWAEAYPVLLVVGGVTALRSVYAVVLAVETAQRRFKAVALMTLLMGLAFVAACGVGGAVYKNAIGVAAVGSLSLAAICWVCGLWSLRRIGAGAADLARGALPAWALAAASAVPAIWVERAMFHSGIGPVVREIAACGVFGLIFVPSVRLLLARDLVDMLRAMPRGMGPRIGRLLHLRLDA